MSKCHILFFESHQAYDWKLFKEGKKAMSRKYCALSFKQKLEIISAVKDKEKTKKELCLEYKCDVSTLNRILRNERKIKDCLKKNPCTIKNKRFRESAHQKVEKALTKWFDQTRSNDGLISTPVLLDKAKQLAVALKVDFKPSNGWLWRWQKRHNIRIKRIHGESNAADKTSAENYVEHTLPLLIKQYKPENVFNADECGLFYKALPSSTLARADSAIKGFKIQKERITLLFICNATGEYKDVIVIGKSKSPHCFKNKLVIPIKYRFHKKAWMDTKIWNAFLSHLDDQMVKEKRKIILFVNNAACHKVIIDLKNINVQFLPSNTTSLIQPLDQGIIHSFKTYYRQIIVRKQILALESGKTIQEFSKSINLYNAMLYVKRALWLIQKETVMNCFQKAKFTQFSSVGLEEEVSVRMDGVLNSFDFENYVQCDDNLQCFGDLSEVEIIEEVLNEQEEDESEDVLEKCLQDKQIEFKTVFEAINLLRNYAIQKNLPQDDIENFETKAYEERLKQMSQSKITDFIHK